MHRLWRSAGVGRRASPPALQCYTAVALAGGVCGAAVGARKPHWIVDGAVSQHGALVPILYGAVAGAALFAGAPAAVPLLAHHVWRDPTPASQDKQSRRCHNENKHIFYSWKNALSRNWRNNRKQ